MRGIVSLLGVLAATLVLLALDARRDRSFLVSPPEAVAESYARELATRRYVRAVAMLTDELATRVSRDSLERFLAALENRWGRVIDARGERVRMDDSVASAAAQLGTALRHSPKMPVELRWQRGEWRVAGFVAPR